jgi:spore coat polysaccharide biosynthesis predicted glycosyltransferase SpsG
LWGLGVSDDLKKIIDNLTEEKNNIEIICNSFKERVRQLEKELSEVKLDNIKLAKQVEDSLKQFRNKGEL